MNAVLLVFTGVVFVSGCGERGSPFGEAESAETDDTRARVVTQAVMHPWPRTIRAQGSLVEDEQAQLGVKVAGRVKEVLVDLGSTVAEGAVVVILESEEFDLRVKQTEAQVAQARATLGLAPGEPEESLDRTKAAPVLQQKAMLEEAKFNLNRRRTLRGKSVVTTEELQQYEALHRVAEARYESALNTVDEQIALLAVRRAELAVAKQSQADAVLKAPFEGVIKARHVAPGSYVNVGDPVATLVRTNPLRFRAGIPERSSTQLRVGQTVRVYVEGETTPVPCKIARVSPSLDLASRSLVIEADLENADSRFRTGLFAEAEIVVDADERTLAVPESSIVEFAGVEKVWVVRDEKAHGQRVRTGRRQGNLVEILEGLNANDQVLANGDEGREGPVSVATAAETTELTGG
jgi:RND family efflux transporter MFP subunit